MRLLGVVVVYAAAVRAREATNAARDTREDLSRDWTACRATGRPCGAAAWPAPALPTTALFALLASPHADDLFATPPTRRESASVVDPYYSSNLLAIKDVNETGPAFYTLRYERRLTSENRLLEIPGANYRATVFADGAEVSSLNPFGGLFARRRYVLPPNVTTLAIEVAPPDHCGSPTCSDPTAVCGQGGDHQLARDVTAQHFGRVAISLMNRGDAAAGTWIFRGDPATANCIFRRRVAATPRPRRG